MQAEVEDDQDQTHAESMHDNTTDMIVGTMRIVIIIDLIVTWDEAAEATNKIDVVVEALDVIIIIITIMAVEATINRATIITIKHRTSSTVIIMIRVYRS